MNRIISESKDSIRVIPPFLKWAGGKRWLVDKYEAITDIQFDRYIEPFLGSGAVFFRLAPEKAILADTNSQLIETYQAIRDDWKSVQDLLQKHHQSHCKEYYYLTRQQQPITLAERAAKFIYLNRTCWNGLYRVNLKGEFNVPIGTKTNVVLDTDDFEAVSVQLSGIELLNIDFETTLSYASTGDFVFVDPPYTVKHNNNGFVKYNESLFTWDDQVRLKHAVEEAVKRGAKVIVTNANHECIRDLYDGIGEQIILNRASVIAGSKEKRGRFEEIVIKCV